MPNPNPKISGLTRDLVLILLSAVCGGLAGGSAGFYASSYSGYERLPPVISTSTAQSVKVVATTSTFALVQVGRPALTSVVPPAFLKQRGSFLGTIYRTPKVGVFEDRFLTNDRMLGQAVAVTSDGWFITSASAITGLKTADMVIWYGGSSYAVDRGVIDRLNGTVYLKTSAKDVQSASFTRAQDLVVGGEAWSEYRPGEIAPHVILDLSRRNPPDEMTSSEVAARRVILDGVSALGDLGGGVWDANGQLVGIVDSKPGETARIIPAASIAASFSSLLGTGEIRHAYLGVRAYDLAALKLSGDREGLPLQGALVRDEKKGGKPGVVLNSPAAKAKLKSGDVILKVERDILDGTADLGEVLSEYRPGSSVTLRILRDKTDMDVSVVLGSVVTSEVLK